jgi:hypothetical protein
MAPKQRQKSSRGTGTSLQKLQQSVNIELLSESCGEVQLTAGCVLGRSRARWVSLVVCTAAQGALHPGVHDVKGLRCVHTKGGTIMIGPMHYLSQST